MEKKLIIFDVGGVLRDSSEAMDQGYRRGFASVNLEYNFRKEDVWHLRGLGKYNDSFTCVRALIALSHINGDLKELLERKDSELLLDEIVAKNFTQKDESLARKVYLSYKEFFNSSQANNFVKLSEGIGRVIRRFKENGFELAIFTDAGGVTVERDLDGIGLNNFSVIISKEDVKQRKPSGEGIVKIMKKLGVEPKNTYYVGDSMVDIMAGKDAKCVCIAVLSGMGLEHDLRRLKPDFIFKNVLEMSEQIAKK